MSPQACFCPSAKAKFTEMKYPTQLDLQREDDSIMLLLCIVITYISCRDDEERSDITRLFCAALEPELVLSALPPVESKGLH